MEASLSEQVAAVVSLVEGVYGSDLVAAYLFGSAVAGGLKPASDVDVFAVVRRRSTDSQKRQLIDGLRTLSSRHLRPEGWRPVDLSLVALADVKPWRYPPRMDFQHGEWLRERIDAGELAPYEANNPDLVLQMAQVHQSHAVLRGLPAHEVLDSVPLGDIERALRASVEDLLGDAETDTTNVILTLARIWASLVTHEFMSKDAAADWAASRIAPLHSAVIRRARDVYLGTANVHWTDVGPQVAAAIGELANESKRP